MNQVFIFFLFLVYITFTHTDTHADNPLIEAINANDKDRVKALLSEGSINVNDRGGGKFLPVELAFIKGDTEIVKMLIGVGGDAEVLREVTEKFLVSSGADIKAIRSLDEEHRASLHKEVMKLIRRQINPKVAETSNTIDFQHYRRFRNACQIIFN